MKGKILRLEFQEKLHNFFGFVLYFQNPLAFLYIYIKESFCRPKVLVSQLTREKDTVHVNFHAWVMGPGYINTPHDLTMEASK